MPQAFQARKFFIPKTDPKQEVYKPVPYYFGTLSTQDAADQIAEESSLTKGDVLNVLDRYQRYVIKNLQKGAAPRWSCWGSEPSITASSRRRG